LAAREPGVLLAGEGLESADRRLGRLTESSGECLDEAARHALAKGLGLVDARLLRGPTDRREDLGERPFVRGQRSDLERPAQRGDRALAEDLGDLTGLEAFEQARD